MRIGSALLSAACIVSGIVVIEARQGPPQEAVPETVRSTEPGAAGGDDAFSLDGR